MTIKQNILSVVAMLLMASISLAGPLDRQPTVHAQPTANAQSTGNSQAPFFGLHHYFVQFDAAYAKSDWESIVPSSAQVNGNSQNGFFYGGVFGVSLIPHVYFDLGVFHLPTVDYSQPSGGQISSWLVDVSGKLLVPVPVITSLDFFGSVGFGYRIINDSKNAVGNRSYWMPVFGAGAQYDIYQNLFFGIEYMRIARDNGPSAAPRVNTYLAFLNYEFGT